MAIILNEVAKVTIYSVGLFEGIGELLQMATEKKSRWHILQKMPCNIAYG
jgi:hypothetical protein